MGLDIEKIKESSTWIPDKRAIQWTEQWIGNQLKKSECFIWVSSFFSIKFSTDLNYATITDVNFPIYEPSEKTFENLARTIKILEKLNYNVDSNEKIVANLGIETRVIDDRTIDKYIYIPKSKYSDKN
jgi:hypothetical protein